MPDSAFAMTPDLTLKALRTLAYYHSDAGLQQRLAHTEDIIRRQREGLAWAVAEIERLQAELDRCKSTAPAV